MQWTGIPTAWNPGTDNGPVEALALRGNTIYVGGFFTAAGGQPRHNLAALDATTGAPTVWNPGTSDVSVRALAVSGSTVYIGGNFIMAGGQLHQKPGRAQRRHWRSDRLEPHDQ